MTWTFERPTKPGWYLGVLHHALPGGVPYLIKRIWDPDGEQASVDLAEDNMTSYAGPWFGPIPVVEP